MVNNKKENDMGRKPKTEKRGFTLIELMLVVIIIGVLAAMVVPKLTGRSEQAKITAAKAEINGSLSTAIELYELDNGEYPDELKDLWECPPDLEKAPEGTWAGPYLKKKNPKDPWGKEYKYKKDESFLPGYKLWTTPPGGKKEINNLGEDE